MSSAARTFGRYDLLLELSKGPFGSLWVAREGGSGDVVMLRQLRLEPSADSEEGRLTQAAAQWAVGVRGAGVVDALQWVVAGDELGLVTRYHAGEPLRSLLRLASFKRRAFVPGAALRVALDVLDALDSLDRGAKPPEGLGTVAALLPDSVVVGTDGRSLVIDVGVGCAVRRARAYAELAEITAYLAPEEVGGETEPDERTTVFTLGVLLWEMMSGGRRLFAGATHDAIVERIKDGPIPRLDASRPPGGGPVPKAVADVVARALERDRAQRWSTRAELRHAIQELGDSMLGNAQEVAAIVNALAGNALAARDRSIERALEAPVDRKASASAVPAGAAKRKLLGIAPLKPSRTAQGSKSGTPESGAASPVSIIGRAPPKPAAKAKERSAPSHKKPPKQKQGSTARTAAGSISMAAGAGPARANPDDESPASADRRLLDALTSEPLPSERAPKHATPPQADLGEPRPSDQRNSDTPSESLTASKDSTPAAPSRPARGLRSRHVRLAGYAGAASLLVIAAYAVTSARRATTASEAAAPLEAPASAVPPAAAVPSAQAAPPEPSSAPPAPTIEPSASAEPTSESETSTPEPSATAESSRVTLPPRTSHKTHTKHRAAAKRVRKFTPSDI